jgi:hydroxyacylglutathione hydrolase
MVLTGDCLFVNDVGRTDLVNLPLTGPEVMYDSVMRLLALPDDCEIYPAHYGGSACGGKQMSGKVSSTIGFERRFNWMLQASTREEFVKRSGAPPREAVEAVLQHRNTNRGVLPLPDDLGASTSSHSNRWAEVQGLPVDRVLQLSQQGAILLDLRPQLAFASGHPAGAINVAFNQTNLVKRVKALLSSEEAIVTLAEAPLVARRAAQMLVRAGCTVAGYMEASVEEWMKHNLPAESLTIGDLETLHQYVTSGAAVIVDVREPFEWEKGVVPQDRSEVLLISLGEVRKRLHELPCNRTIVLTCESGTRASAVASLLKRMGHRNLINIAPEGMSDYARRYPTVRPVEKAPVM